VRTLLSGTLLATCALLTACAADRPSAGSPSAEAHAGAVPFVPPPDLATAEARWRAAPGDLDAIVWYGRRVAYEGDFERAVAIWTQGLELHPDEPELLRHRGHRYLSLRRYEDARADLERAAVLVERRPDRIELDGMPNRFGIPRGTLHTNVWYHLGLAEYLLRHDEEAARAFARCLALATNDDFRVAAAYWRALALFHLGRTEEARALAELFARRDLELMESFDYALLLRLIAGRDSQALEELDATEKPLSSATLTYGVAMWMRMGGRDAEARARLATLTAFGSSSAFGHLAAEVELARLENGP